MMPLTVEEGIADGVDEVRRAVRYQIKHGAQVIKCCASGGVMSPHRARRAPSSTRPRSWRRSPTRPTGAACTVAAHCPRRHRGQRRARRRHRLHRARLHDDRRPRSSGWSTPARSSCPPTPSPRTGTSPAIRPSCRPRPPRCSRRPRHRCRKAIEAGVKIACGSDAPGDLPRPQRRGARRPRRAGHDPAAGDPGGDHRRAPSSSSADDLGRIAPEMLADIIGVPGDPLTDITVTQQVGS